MALRVEGLLKLYMSTDFKALDDSLGSRITSSSVEDFHHKHHYITAFVVRVTRAADADCICVVIVYSNPTMS